MTLKHVIVSILPSWILKHVQVARSRLLWLQLRWFNGGTDDTALRAVLSFQVPSNTVIQVSSEEWVHLKKRHPEQVRIFFRHCCLRYFCRRHIVVVPSCADRRTLVNIVYDSFLARGVCTLTVLPILVKSLNNWILLGLFEIAYHILNIIQ